MKIIAKGLPSFFTSLALISGCISVVISTTRGDLTLAGYFILISAALDFVDGLAARLLRSISEFGKQLDSLADVVSFGVAPAMILYSLILHSLTGGHLPEAGDLLPWQVVILYSPFLVAVFSALRLAKFNLLRNPGFRCCRKSPIICPSFLLLSFYPAFCWFATCQCFPSNYHPLV
jgi:CDP-diacylglycerol--serine O-phosphatidyltransferase